MKYYFLTFILFFFLSSDCNACSVDKIMTKVGITIDAEIIIRAKVVGQNELFNIDKTEVKFEVLETIKGNYNNDEIHIEGYLCGYSGKVKKSYPNCNSYQYCIDNEYMLFLVNNTPYWTPLAPTNKKILGHNDPWVLWVKNFLTKDNSNISDIVKWGIDESFFDENLYFDTNKFELSSKAKAILEKKIKILKAYTEEKILIEGHCDDRGSEDYNYNLGFKRAKSTKQYLVKSGIDENRIKIISYGENRPVCVGINSKMLSYNRRVVFRLIQ